MFVINFCSLRLKLRTNEECLVSCFIAIGRTLSPKYANISHVHRFSVSKNELVNLQNGSEALIVQNVFLVCNQSLFCFFLVRCVVCLIFKPWRSSNQLGKIGQLTRLWSPGSGSDCGSASLSSPAIRKWVWLLGISWKLKSCVKDQNLWEC